MEFWSGLLNLLMALNFQGQVSQAARADPPSRRQVLKLAPIRIEKKGARLLSKLRRSGHVLLNLLSDFHDEMTKYVDF